MEDLLFDRIGRRYLPFFYYSARVDGLAVVVVSSLFWVYYGWDGVVEQLTGGAYGVGIHWSSIQTFALFFYLLVVNLHVGQLRSLRQLGQNVLLDAEANLNRITNVVPLIFGPRDTAKAEFGKLRESYEVGSAVDPMRAAAFAALFSISALYAFEVVWDPLYDYFQFGSLTWPLWYALDPTGKWYLSQVFLRNFLAFSIPLFLGAVMFYGAFDEDAAGKVVRRFKVDWRFSRTWLLIAAAAVASWLAWVYLPHSVLPLSQLRLEQVISVVVLDPTAFHSTAWIYPRQLLFPQTEYTFYPPSAFMVPYGGDAIYGFWVKGNLVHAVNLAAKYLTFLFVCYPALLAVKRRGA